MSLLKKLGKETFIYGVGKAIGGAISILMVPLYTRVLGSEGYGFVDTLAVATALVYIISVFGFDSSVGFYYFDSKDKIEKKRILFNGLLFRSGLSVVLLIIAVPIVAVLLNNQQSSISSEHIFFITVLAFIKLPFLTIQAYCRDTMRILKKVWLFFWSTVFYSILAASCPIFFVLFLEHGVQGVFEAALAVEVITGLVFLFILRKHFYLSVHGDLIKKMMRYGAPILPTSLMFYALSAIDKVIIIWYLGLAQAGLYAVAYKIVAIAAFAIGSYQLAWGVFGFSIKDHKDAQLTYSKVFTVYSLLFGFIVIVLTLFGFEVLALLSTPEFYPAVNAIGFLCMAQLSLGLFNQFAIGAIVSKKTKNIPKAALIGFVLNICSNLLLIPYMGLLGGAIATFIGYIICSIAMVRYSQQVYHIKYNFNIAYFTFSLCVAISLISILLPKEINISLMILKALVSMIIFILFVVVGKHGLKWSDKVYNGNLPQ